MFSVEVRKNKICKMAIFFGMIDEVLYYAEKKSLQLQTDRILVLEDDKKRLDKSLKEKKWQELLKHPGFEYIFIDEKLFRNLNEYFLKDQNYRYLRAFDFFYNFDEFKNKYAKNIQLMNVIKSSIGYTLMFFGNDAKDSLIGYHNMFNNLDEIINNPGINLLEKAFFGVPAIIIGAGPSLTSSMKYLKGMEDKAIIIAVDAALKPLLDNNIRPHLITTLEREIEVAELFKGISEEDLKDIYLVACPVVYNEVFKEYKGEKMICYRQFDHFKWINIERGMLPIKTSPGNMNFSIAEYLGCDPIIMVGQDMALDGDKTNVEGAVLGDSQQSYHKEIKYNVKGNCKEQVVTTHFLKTVLESFEIDVSNSIAEIINTSKIGAYIEGTKFEELEEVIRRLNTEYNIIEIIKKQLQNFKPSSILFSKKNIKITISWFKKCIEMLENAITLISNDSDFSTKLNTINKTKNNMQDNYIAWQLYFAHISQSAFINHELFTTTFVQDSDSEKEFQEKYIKVHIEYFAVLKGLLQICIQDLIKFRDGEKF